MFAIILFCVFNVTEAPPGTVKSTRIEVTSQEFENLAYEEGHLEKLRHCERNFSEKADLAWIERSP